MQILNRGLQVRKGPRARGDGRTRICRLIAFYVINDLAGFDAIKAFSRLPFRGQLKVLAGIEARLRSPWLLDARNGPRQELP